MENKAVEEPFSKAVVLSVFQMYLDSVDTEVITSSITKRAMLQMPTIVIIEAKSNVM
jgi:hypothetical protein